jgi:hypothetical protein
MTAQLDFAAGIDWDKAFAQLKLWPANRSAEEIGNQTPRQTFQLWRELNDLRKLFLDATGNKTESKDEIGNEPEALLPALIDAALNQPRELEPYEMLEEKASPENKQVMSGVKKPMGVQTIAGLGMDKWPCWRATPDELAEREAGRNPDIDPFVTDRSVIYQRFAAMIFEHGREGRLKQYGIPKKQDEADEASDAACQSYIEQAWRINSANFAGVEKAASAPLLEGMKIITELADAGRLQVYNVHGHDEEVALAFLQHIRSCWARKLSRDQAKKMGECRG